MRLTAALFAQHNGRMFKFHWIVQGRRTPKVSNARAILESHGIPVENAVEHVWPKLPKVRFPIEGEFLPKQQPFDPTHPLWTERVCHTFGDTNLLVEGLQQAQLLTKSMVVDGLPVNVQRVIDDVRIPDQSDVYMQEMVRASFLFETEQQKLPYKTLPDKPMHRLKREYGITNLRRNRVFITKAIQECEKLAGRSVVSDRKVISDALFVVPLEKDGDLLQMEITADAFVTSKKPIEPVLANRTEFSESEIPELTAMKYTISMPKENIYELRNSYPITRTSAYCHPHTVFLHFSTEDVQNLHGIPVTESQFMSRSMVKAFAVAASSARSLYGENVTDLKTPIVVQSIQFNDAKIHFGVFQLNTLNLNGVNGMKNVWFNGPSLKLFSECLYRRARPELDEYNPDVFRYIYGFYRTN